MSEEYTSNPFGRPTEQAPGDANPFGSEETADDTNPFGRPTEQTPVDSNPFDSADTQPNDSVLVITVKSSDGFDITMSQGVEMLVLVGILPDVARGSLLVTKSVQNSFDIIANKIKETCFGGAHSVAPNLWKSPISLRIGSWMPHNESGCNVTFYYISGTILGINKNFNVHRRYSEFHALYLSIHGRLLKSFPKGMQNLFPDNRSSSWVSGETDELRNNRKGHLDAFMREVCLNPVMMMNMKARNKIYEFLGILNDLPSPPGLVYNKLK